MKINISGFPGAWGVLHQDPNQTKLDKVPTSTDRQAFEARYSLLKNKYSLIMKIKTLFHILLCMCSFILITSCDKADQNTPVNVASNGQLTSRSGSCDNCGIDDCCCGFELRDPGFATTFRVCGFNNGTSTCAPTPPSGCGTISGGFISEQLDSDDPKFAFCMLQGNCFQIENITPMSTGEIRISCDYDVTSPTFTNVTIPYGWTFTWCVDGSCEFELCDP